MHIYIGFGLGLGLMWCYGHGKFRVSLRVGLKYGLG